MQFVKACVCEDLDVSINEYVMDLTAFYLRNRDNRLLQVLHDYSKQSACKDAKNFDLSPHLHVLNYIELGVQIVALKC